MKRVNLFLGHYGTGKTNIALNFALMIKNNVIVYDLDIVNPYFRTLDGKDILEENNIELIASDYANTNVDCPAMNPECYRMIREKDKFAVVDVGGDDRGAYALGRFRNEILKENDYDMFLIINKYRYETRTPEETLEIMKEIEEVAGIKFTEKVYLFTTNRHFHLHSPSKSPPCLFLRLQAPSLSTPLSSHP